MFKYWSIRWATSSTCVKCKWWGPSISVISNWKEKSRWFFVDLFFSLNDLRFRCILEEDRSFVEAAANADSKSWEKSNGTRNEWQIRSSFFCFYPIKRTGTWMLTIKLRIKFSSNGIKPRWKRNEEKFSEISFSDSNWTIFKAGSRVNSICWPRTKILFIIENGSFFFVVENRTFWVETNGTFGQQSTVRVADAGPRFFDSSTKKKSFFRFDFLYDLQVDRFLQS